MERKQEYQELKHFCGGKVSETTLKGWHAAKEEIYIPPESLSDSDQDDWYRGNQAYQAFIASEDLQKTKLIVYREGMASFSKNKGTLINPYNDPVLANEFERGWEQAFRRNPEAYKPGRSGNGVGAHQSLREKYSGMWEGSPGAVPDGMNRYKAARDGE